MFRHKRKVGGLAEIKADTRDKYQQGKDDDKESADEDVKNSSVESGQAGREDVSDGNGDIKSLLEKNLKWSQIIYEQNRRLNRKLLWSAIAGWLRLLIILVPLALAFLYLPSILKNVWAQYGGLLGQTVGDGAKLDSDSFSSIIKMFNFTPAQKEQMRSMLK